jgi:hypothetical protein
MFDTLTRHWWAIALRGAAGTMGTHRLGDGLSRRDTVGGL